MFSIVGWLFYYCSFGCARALFSFMLCVVSILQPTSMLGLAWLCSLQHWNQIELNRTYTRAHSRTPFLWIYVLSSHKTNTITRPQANIFCITIEVDYVRVRVAAAAAQQQPLQSVASQTVGHWQWCLLILVSRRVRYSLAFRIVFLLFRLFMLSSCRDRYVYIYFFIVLHHIFLTFSATWCIIHLILLSHGGFVCAQMYYFHAAGIDSMLPFIVFDGSFVLLTCHSFDISGSILVAVRAKHSRLLLHL